MVDRFSEACPGFRFTHPGYVGHIGHALLGRVLAEK